VAGKKERQRRLARQRYERRTRQRAQEDRQIRRWTVGALAAVGLAAVVVGAFFLVNASSSPGKTAAGLRVPRPPSEPARHCTYTASPPAARNVGFPPATPDYKAVYQATINTNRGRIVIDLLNSKATCTVNSFVYLASKKYFNNTSCQRLTTSGIFTLQCGDPTGTGHGGPGYKFDDENLPGATYTAGTVAMANTAPDSDGSQFFLVYKDSPLSASYTPFGKIVSGLAVITNVAKAGSDDAGGSGDGQPKEKVVIESVTVTKT
jgi:cyclophilin family peptidyl-prolyl cis-trans isomerase